jgi:hypothetical protein
MSLGDEELVLTSRRGHGNWKKEKRKEPGSPNIVNADGECINRDTY